MRKQSIQKNQIAIQAYVDLIKSNNGKPKSRDVKDLIKKHKVSSSLTTDILRANIVKE